MVYARCDCGMKLSIQVDQTVPQPHTSTDQLRLERFLHHSTLTGASAGIPALTADRDLQALGSRVSASGAPAPHLACRPHGGRRRASSTSGCSPRRGGFRGRVPAFPPSWSIGRLRIFVSHPPFPYSFPPINATKGVTGYRPRAGGNGSFSGAASPPRLGPG